MKTDTLERPVEGAPARGDAARASDAGEPIDFSTFVISLGSNVMVHLGVVDALGEASSGPPDYALAQQTIDILAMLEVKTRGNLSQDEAQLLSGVLYQSRLAFLEVRKRFGDA